MSFRFLGLAIVVIVFLIGSKIRVSSYGYSWNSSQKQTSPQLRSDFRFTDITAQQGIHFKYESPKLDPLFEDKERIFFASGSGVSVADVNGDGWMDILLVSAKQGGTNHLYINQMGQGFRESAKEWGIDRFLSHGASVAPVFFDFNNDEKPDLYIARLGCSQLYMNTGNKFIDISQDSGVTDCKNSSGAIPLDFNNDGLLDLYIVRFWNDHNYFKLNTPFVAPENLVNATNGGVNTLYQNLGNGKFQDVTQSSGGGDTHWSWDAAAGDFFNDGSTQLLVANDTGPDTLYSIRNSKLMDESARLGIPDRRDGMGVSLGDLDHDGKPHIFVSNEYLESYNQTGNFLWKFENQNLAQDEALQRNVSSCGWAWGSVFADFDLDGEQDLYVANGLISQGAPIDYESYEEILEKKAQKQNPDYAFVEGTLMAVPGAFVSDLRLWPRLKGRSLAGHQLDCFFWNRGDHFENISQAIGIRKTWDGRGVAAVDFDNNGSMDLILTTQSDTAHLLKNNIQPRKDWLSLFLIGTKSNRDAVGAKIQLTQGERKWYRWATGGKTGFLAISDPRLHFGIPKEGPLNITITWPSGIEQSFKNIERGNHYTAVEGEKILRKSGS